MASHYCYNRTVQAIAKSTPCDVARVVWLRSVLRLAVVGVCTTKGFYRLGCAFIMQQAWPDAVQTLQAGLQLAPDR